MTTYDEMTAVLDTMNAEIIEENALRAQYPYNVTYDEIRAMDKDARRELETALGAILEAQVCGIQWELAYAVYQNLTEIIDAEYYAENAKAFHAWCDEHITGKSREEIDSETWAYYSDWHKDMYGHRPHWN